ncbi:MAG: DOPA 4,5-dioxygenase family protein [Pseudomonadota bacterium]
MNPIRGYHAHVYFDLHEQQLAADLREKVSRQLGLRVGTLYPTPIGPHPKGMFQVLVPVARLGELIGFMLAHRRGLDVLVHAETGDDWIDHTTNTVWIGRSQPLNLDFLRPDVPTGTVAKA